MRSNYSQRGTAHPIIHPTILLIALASLLLVGNANTANAQPPAQFLGTTDNNWFDPTNWSTGLVPDANTDVLLDGNARPVIDPALGMTDVTIRDLSVIDTAGLTTLAGTRIFTRNEFIDASGFIHYQSSESVGDTLTVGPNPADPAAPTPGIKFNPTPKTKRIVVLQSSFHLDFGLGETLAASPGNVGAGHYATLTAETIDLAGILNVSLYYGFVPHVGDVFQLITASSASSGQFDNLREGGTVASFGDVALRITYAGGDGNDVLLQAVAAPEPGTLAFTLPCLLCLALPIFGMARSRSL